MYDKNNIFAKILRKEIPCNKVYEDEASLFFYDINPQAKIHVLGIPKIECSDFYDFVRLADKKTLSSFFESVSLVIKKLNIEKTDIELFQIQDHMEDKKCHTFIFIFSLVKKLDP